MIKKSILTVTISSFSLLAAVPLAAQTTTTGTTGANNYVMPGTSGGSAADSGRSAEKGQLLGAVANVGAAAMYTGICATVYGSWACPLAGLAAIAASMLNKGAKGSGAAGASMSAYDPALYGGNGLDGTTGDNGTNINGGGSGNGNGSTIGSNGNGPTTLPDGSTAATVDRDLARIRRGLEGAGVQISDDGKTMKTKDGRTFDLSKGGDGSTEGLLAMGLTASEAAQADAASKNISAQMAKKIAALSVDGAGGGGGGGRNPAGDAGAGGGGFGMGGWGQDPRNKKRAPAKVSGLTRKLGDDTIGVSGDNIFEMVTRRYKARDQNGNFLKD